MTYTVDLYEVVVPSGHTYGAIYIPRYVIPIMRAKAAKRWGSTAVKGMTSCISTFEGNTSWSFESAADEYARCRGAYDSEAFDKAYPTEASFYEALEAESGAAGVATSDREKQPIEEIKGIGPAIADAIVTLLGDGELATLAQANASDISGATETLSYDKATKFIYDAKVLVEDEDEEVEE